MVDDHQESTAATARLLRVLADDGARLLLLGDPDAAVQTDVADGTVLPRIFHNDP